MSDPPPGIPTSRVDERDTIFARMERRPGTPAHADTYARRPDLLGTDERLRSLPPLFRPGGFHHDPGPCGEAQRILDRIPRIAPDPVAVEAWAARLRISRDPAAVLRDLALFLGAVAAGCAPLDPAFLYSHKGRFDEEYGRPVRLAHGSAFVFLVEMDHAAMRRAPRAEALLESARRYHLAAVIAKTAEAVLRACGHDAKAHHDAHYDMMLPPLAAAAGLGEIGRHNILIADRFGARVRIAAVTTDCPLEHDRPLPLGVRRFCKGCRKCAENCPSRALSAGEPVEVRGVRRWPTDAERCYGFWRRAGTDCGICMAVCPFSHPDAPFHNLVRRMVRGLPWLDPLLLWFDDRTYGRLWDQASPR